MPRLTISPQQFAEKVNALLPKYMGYLEGLRVFIVPAGADGWSAGGYDWTHRDQPGTDGAVAAAVKEVLADHDVIPPLHRVN